MGRLTTAGLMVCAALTTLLLATAKEAFDLILSIGAGTGLLYLLRWFWWRVSAWSEVAAMISSFVVALGFFIARKWFGVEVASHVSLLATVAVTTVVWVAVTFLAPPTDRGTLVSFYRLVRPAGPGWTSVRAEAGVEASPDSPTRSLLGWVLGCVFVYAALFGAGSFLYGRTGTGVLWLAAFVVSGGSLVRLMPKLWGSSTAG
jgi:hypothetical protein